MSRPVGLRCFLGSLLAGSCLLFSLQACGGRSDTEDYLFGDGSGAANGTGATGPTGAGAGAGARGPTGQGPSGQGANGQGANGQGGNDSGVGAATSTGGQDSGEEGPMGEGGFATGGFDTGGTGQGGSAPMGMAGEGSAPTIGCAATRCDARSQVCCVGLGATGCISSEQQCNGAALTCTNTAECPDDQVCCLRVLGDVGGSSQCKQRCVTNGMPQNRERQLCSSDRECSTNHCRPTVFGVNMCTRR